MPAALRGPENFLALGQEVVVVVQLTQLLRRSEKSLRPSPPVRGKRGRRAASGRGSGAAPACDRSRETIRPARGNSPCLPRSARPPARVEREDRESHIGIAWPSQDNAAGTREPSAPISSVRPLRPATHRRGRRLCAVRLATTSSRVGVHLLLGDEFGDAMAHEAAAARRESSLRAGRDLDRKQS